MKKSTIENCKILEFNSSKNLSDLNITTKFQGIPFKIKRVYYLYDIPKTATRGGHAHYKSEELLVAVNGSFQIDVFDGYDRKNFVLNGANQGLYFPSGLWSEIKNFSKGAICVVFSSITYSETDYIRNFQTFLDYKRNSKIYSSN
jgi:dTDP-4-dehydrorhamnose 3,5-epimerase-like enzyme